MLLTQLKIKEFKKKLIKLCELWGSDFRTFSTTIKINYFYRNIKKLINFKKIKMKIVF